MRGPGRAPGPGRSGGSASNPAGKGVPYGRARCLCTAPSPDLSRPGRARSTRRGVRASLALVGSLDAPGVVAHEAGRLGELPGSRLVITRIRRARRVRPEPGALDNHTTGRVGDRAQAPGERLVEESARVAPKGARSPARVPAPVRRRHAHDHGLPGGEGAAGGLHGVRAQRAPGARDPDAPRRHQRCHRYRAGPGRPRPGDHGPGAAGSGARPDWSLLPAGSAGAGRGPLPPRQRPSPRPGPSSDPHGPPRPTPASSPVARRPRAGTRRRAADAGAVRGVRRPPGRNGAAGGGPRARPGYRGSRLKTAFDQR